MPVNKNIMKGMCFMLKTIYNNCAGIDVHKKTIVVTIAKTDKNNITTYQTKSFSTFTDDLITCRDWLVENETFDICMESTGKYWIPVFNILEIKCKCVITHPKYVRSVPGKKTDKKDSKWIADIFKHGLVEPSFMPPKDIRNLRDLMRYRNKLVNIRTGEKIDFKILLLFLMSKLLVLYQMFLEKLLNLF